MASIPQDDAGLAKRILVVDDEADILSVVRFSLEVAGFEVATADSGEAALQWVEANGLPHLAVVDIRMPGMNGLELCERLQAAADLPVILLTAVDDEPTVIQAIETVAEDYVTKPFRPAILAARVKRVLGRMGDYRYTLGSAIEIDEHLTIKLGQRCVVLDGQEVELTPRETKILHILLSKAPRPVRSRYLLRRVWPVSEVFEEALRVHVHRLRQKIEPDPSHPRYLLTERGEGYRFAADL
jgi:DNA-binding response OmpR family regulator